MVRLKSCPIDPARKQWHRIPTHFRKKRGNGWGTLTVCSCRINKKKQDSGCAARLTIQMDGLRKIFIQMQQVSKLAGCDDQRKFHSSAGRRSRWGTDTLRMILRRFCLPNSFAGTKLIFILKKKGNSSLGRRAVAPDRKIPQ
jgi:hypothetical protein